MNKHFKGGAIAVICLLTGWTIGEFAAPRMAKADGTELTKGQDLPMEDIVVHGASGEMLLLRAMYQASDTTVFIIFNPGCTSCLGEAAKWNDLRRSHPNVQLVALANTPDPNFVREFRDQVEAEFQVWRTDDTIIGRLKPSGLPVVIVANHNRASFVSAGSASTDAMEEWFADPANR